MIGDIAALVVPAAVGGLLGVAYFGALWLGLRRLPRVAQPGRWLALGAALRLAALLPALYLVMDGRWERLVACLLGFVATRLVLTVWARGRAAAPSPQG